MNQLLTVHIRWALQVDVPSLLEIEAGCHLPLSEDKVRWNMKKRDNINLLAEHGDRTVGYMVYRLKGDDTLELKRLAVHPDWRGQGVGQHLLNKMLSKMSPQRRYLATCLVRETNLAMQTFLRHHGFFATGIRRGVFPDTHEDGYTMEYQL